MSQLFLFPVRRPNLESPSRGGTISGMGHAVHFRPKLARVACAISYSLASLLPPHLPSRSVCNPGLRPPSLRVLGGAGSRADE